MGHDTPQQIAHRVLLTRLHRSPIFVLDRKSCERVELRRICSANRFEVSIVVCAARLRRRVREDRLRLRHAQVAPRIMGDTGRRILDVTKVP